MPINNRLSSLSTDRLYGIFRGHLCNVCEHVSNAFKISSFMPNNRLSSLSTDRLYAAVCTLNDIRLKNHNITHNFTPGFYKFVYFLKKRLTDSEVAVIASSFCKSVSSILELCYGAGSRVPL